MKTEYKLCCRPSSPGYGLNIHEVLLDSKNHIINYSKTPVSPSGDTVDEIYQDFYKMWQSIESYEEPIDLDRVDRKIQMMKK